MSTLKTLRSRIKTVRATQKITTAMKLVSAAKLRKTQEQLNAFYYYDEGFNRMWGSLLQGAYLEDLPEWLCTQQNAGKLLIVFMADRGLCGSYNANMLRFIKKQVSEDNMKYGRVDLLPLGHKAMDMLRKEYGKRFVRLLFPSREQKPSVLEFLHTTTEFLIEHLSSKAYSSVCVCYTRFHSVLRQTIQQEELLIEKTINISPGFPPLFEPSRKTLIEQLAPSYLSNTLRRAYSESQTSEQAARMRAMETATNNANDVLNKLRRTYNRTRQAGITRELIEIISGANALEH